MSAWRLLRSISATSRSLIQTVVRGSYAMFASQLGGDEAKFVSPIQYSYAYYNAVDQNSDGVGQIGEILFNQGLQGYSGFDPTDPASTARLCPTSPSARRSPGAGCSTCCGIR